MFLIKQEKGINTYPQKPEKGRYKLLQKSGANSIVSEGNAVPAQNDPDSVLIMARIESNMVFDETHAQYDNKKFFHVSTQFWRKTSSCFNSMFVINF